MKAQRVHRYLFCSHIEYETFEQKRVLTKPAHRFLHQRPHSRYSTGRVLQGRKGHTGSLGLLGAFSGLTPAHLVPLHKDPSAAPADGAGVVIFNDGGEASPGEASPRCILSSSPVVGFLFTPPPFFFFPADSAQQHDTGVGQKRGNAAHSSHSGEQRAREGNRKRKQPPLTG